MNQKDMPLTEKQRTVMVWQQKITRFVVVFILFVSTTFFLSLWAMTPSSLYLIPPLLVYWLVNAPGIWNAWINASVLKSGKRGWVDWDGLEKIYDTVNKGEKLL